MLVRVVDESVTRSRFSYARRKDSFKQVVLKRETAAISRPIFFRSVSKAIMVYPMSSH